MSAASSPSSPAPWGDQDNGTYRNPILPGDYADPDIVRDGDRYYLITSSFQQSPGMPILESLDLINWRTIGHAIPDLAALDPRLNWDAMAGYNDGVYAGSLRKLSWLERSASGELVPRTRWFVHTTLFSAGFVVSTADDVRGPWTARFMFDRHGRPLRARRWDDPCPYWEFNDDGTLKSACLVASKLPGAWYLHLFQLSLDGTQLLDGDLDFMNTEGDTTRRRTGPTPSASIFSGSDSGDPKGELLHRDTGAVLYGTRTLQDCHQAELNSAGDFLSVLHATHYPNREGTVTNDYFSAEASKIIRFGPDTAAGRSTFTGRHGENQRVSDYVYHFHSEYWDGFRMPILRRAKSPYGDHFDSAGHYLRPGAPGDPGAYETQRIMVNLAAPVPTREPNQGGFIDVPAHISTDGEEHWYWLTHHGEKEVYPECRPSSLLPVTWRDGWPFPGLVPDADKHRSAGAPDKNATPYDGSGLAGNTDTTRHHPHQPLIPGVMQWHATKPPLRASSRDFRFQGSDSFASPSLSPNWKWNHAPRDAFWSLSARPGWLRLHAFATVDRSDDFFKIGNVLCQTYAATPRVRIEVTLDLSGLKPGQEAGLAHFGGRKHRASLGVFQLDDGRRILRYNQIPSAVAITGDTLRLRSEIGSGRLNNFSFSLDEGRNYTAWPDTYALRSADHRGDLIGLYTFNNRATGDSPAFGHADFTAFHYDF